jgi:hypothetical protein
MKADLMKMRQRIETQGFLGLTDLEIRQINPWLRLAPGLCLVWIAIGVVNASPIILGMLVPFAFLGGVSDGHPFDVIYNHGIRHLLGLPELPDYRAPRRFACLMASTALSTAAILFAVGLTVPGYIIGGAMMMMATTNVLTGICGPAVIYGRLFGPTRAVSVH